MTPTGHYRYALVQLEPDDPVPTLLLSQEGDDYSNRVRLFQYDPDADLVIQPEESLEEYGGGGGYASGLSLQGDGVGLRLTEVAGGTGSTDITRVTLQDGSLVREKQWSGRMDARSPGAELHGRPPGMTPPTLPRWTAGRRRPGYLSRAARPALPEAGQRAGSPPMETASSLPAR